MAVNKYILVADVTLPAGTAATVVAGEPGTGGAAGFGGAPTTGGPPPWPVTYKRGQEIALDPAGALFTQIGAGNLRQVTPAQESGGSYWDGELMSRVVITSAVSVEGYRFKKGDVVELTSAQVTAFGASARAVTFRDQLGEQVAASNSTT